MRFLKKSKVNTSNIYMKFGKILVFILLPAFLIFSPNNLIPAQKNNTSSLTTKTKSKKKKKSSRRRFKRRTYNPALTRTQAIEMIRTHSEVVSDIAGLEPIFSDSAFVYDDYEEYEDDILFCEPNQKAIDFFDEELDFDDEEVLPIDMETFKMLWLSYVDDGKNDYYTLGGINKESLMGEVMQWLGTPYKFGGNSKKAIDCSAFIQKVFISICDITLPRTARIQINVGTKVRRKELEFGDLIFFHTYTNRFASHVGIYLGDGLFTHASSRCGVTVSSLDSKYYSTHYIGARRLYLNDLERYSNRKSSYGLSD